MKRHVSEYFPLIAAIPVAIPATSAAAQPADGRMNIVYIMSDDHAYQAISAYGHPLSAQAPTPNIDRIAEMGVRFDRAYVENSLSTPSRACLMTGLYSHQNGQTQLTNMMDSTVTFIPQLMHAAGYQTAVFGKWHMQVDPKGFDTYRILRGQGEYYNPFFKSEKSKAYVQEQGYATELITKHALDFLETRDKSRPFCLYVHHKAPHRTWEPDLKYISLYEDVEFPLPDTFGDDYSTRGTAAHIQKMRIDEHMSMINDLKFYGYMNSPHPTDKAKNIEGNLRTMTQAQRQAWNEAYAKMNEPFFAALDTMSHETLVWNKFQRYVRDYLRVIHSVDESVGEILDYLEANGLMDNTIVVYTSDQGFYMGEHGWFDKRFMYEESLRTPLIVYYPGMTGGRTSETLVQNLDFGPTFLDVAGADKPAEMSGRSMVPVLRKDGKTPAGWRKYLYYHFYDSGGQHNVMRHDGVFGKRYKLIHFYDENGKIESYDEFYDLRNDPDELNNVIDDKRYSKLIGKYRKILAGIREEQAVKEF